MRRVEETETGPRVPRRWVLRGALVGGIFVGLIAVVITRPPPRIELPLPESEPVSSAPTSEAADRSDPHYQMGVALQEDCDAGDGTACSSLAAVYWHGAWGYPQDVARTEALLLQSCRQGFVPGCRGLLWGYVRGYLRVIVD